MEPQKNPKTLRSLSWEPEANAGICLSFGFPAFSGSLSFRIHHQNQTPGCGQVCDWSLSVSWWSSLDSVGKNRYLYPVEYSTVQCWWLWPGAQYTVSNLTIVEFLTWSGKAHSLFFIYLWLFLSFPPTHFSHNFPISLLWPEINSLQAAVWTFLWGWDQFNDLVLHWEPTLSEKSLPSVRIVPWHLVTVLQGEDHQYEQNLSSVQPWLLRNVESLWVFTNDAQEAETNNWQAHVLSKKTTMESLFVFLHPWILVVPVCAARCHSTTSATCQKGLELSLMDVGTHPAQHLTERSAHDWCQPLRNHLAPTNCSSQFVWCIW